VEVGGNLGSAAAMTSPALLDIRGLHKSFGGEHALEGVNLEVAPGEVHGLLGANGSGKSTLIKILAGYHAADAGTISVRGELVSLPFAPGQAQALGLAFVHQDLGLVPSLTVLENYLLGSLAASRRSMWVSWRVARRSMRAALARYELDLDPRMLVGDLRPVDRALLAIVRALESPGVEVKATQRLIVLDEPTVFLPHQEVSRLFELVRRVAARGSSVLFVSHDLDEVREITDRITILRNGQVALSGATSALGGDQLVEAIVGSKLSVSTPQAIRPTPTTDAALTVSDLAAGLVTGISFEAHPGEIVGLTGLLGSGYDDVVRAAAGAIKASAGTLTLGRDQVDLLSWTPHKAISHGVVLIPGDRLQEGVVPDLPITDNVTMVGLREYVHGGLLSRPAMVRNTNALAEAYDVRPRDPSLLIGQLSGGNQQKVVLGKWMQTSPSLLLLHEPTQGVDVGARQQIFQTIRQDAAGRVTICASSDHDQLAQLCDRVLVLRRGQIAIELTGTDVTKSRITEECLRGTGERTAQS
jgi:ribose transport system ATP-binding protein